LRNGLAVLESDRVSVSEIGIDVPKALQLRVKSLSNFVFVLSPCVIARRTEQFAFICQAKFHFLPP